MGTCGAHEAAEWPQLAAVLGSPCQLYPYSLVPSESLGPGNGHAYFQVMGGVGSQGTHVWYTLGTTQNSFHPRATALEMEGERSRAQPSEVPSP